MSSVPAPAGSGVRAPADAAADADAAAAASEAHMTRLDALIMMSDRSVEEINICSRPPPTFAQKLARRVRECAIM